MRTVRVCLAGSLLASVMLAPAPAQAQETAKLKVTLSGVHSARGNIVVGLCDDPAKPFPGGCGTGYQVAAPASQGVTTVIFPAVKPGDYAVQVFHDENGDNLPNIPPEGFGYGNNQPYPPDFKKASIHVVGDTSTEIALTYLSGEVSAQPAKQGSQGVAAPAGAKRIDVRDNGIYGEFYLPEAKGEKLPAIILIGGSEGGLDVMSRMAPGFLTHGYAVMVIAYFQEQGLPQTLEKIPVEYFDKSLAWLKARPEVDAQRIGAVGGSRGSEAVLLLASRNRDVHAVLAFAPSGVLWAALGANPAVPGPAWTLNGAPLPFVTPDGMKFSPQSYRPMFEAAMAAGIAPEAVIPVEKINGPVLLISGEDDKLWPSTPMADDVIRRLNEKTFKFAHTHLHYPGVGHIVFMGDPSDIPADRMPSIGPVVLGGEVKASHAAWADAWQRTLKFFDDALKANR